ncbi:MAG TPA: ABC transporter ATP-binding protein [Verrucomicrobiae bacterium]|jgi:ABC-2 type transport system ATP-binding protein|nr:ABC transporter ATP-binding protein [Verrucomicrobiae bacterium]
MNANAIEIRGLKKSFGHFQLGSVDLTVPQGSIYGFIGPNGAGKTTTLDLIMGMGDADEGSISVLGLDHRRDEVAVKRQVAYASPDTNYTAWGKVWKLIRFVSGFYPSWDEAYCQRLLEKFQVRVEDKIATLSFGTRVKLGLLLALSWHPKVILLDEPTAGLDAVAKTEIFSELLAAVQDEERTVMISSHGLTDLERFADNIGLIKNGQMVLEGTTSELLDRFQLVDFVATNGEGFTPREGLIIQKHENDRWQALVDRRKLSLKTLNGLGARQLSTTPVTLEDVFVALAGKSIL